MEKTLYKSAKGDYKFWMAYPANESFALASLGYMWLFMLADKMPGIDAQRVCADLITNDNYNKVNAISFSMSFDFDFMGVFELLDKTNIPFLSFERDEHYPLIFAGGPVITTNPEPYKKIFDFMIIGDGEKLFIDVLEVLKKCLNKKDTLSELSNIEGVYVPGITKTVNKITETLNDVIYTPIISDKSYFNNTFIIELSRGCMNRCAFCTASYINLPFRYYDYSKIIDTINLGLGYTNKIALLGAQISAHPNFNDIMKYLSDKIISGENIELGISSLRTDAITPELIKTLVLGGQKTTTIAIEAASERLRSFINKNLKDEQIFDAVRIARENGLKGIKIYAMIGIPGETNKDIEAFISLAEELKKQNKGFEITFSFSTFVPKPQTPFQWSIREDTKTLEKKQQFLEKALRKLGIGNKFSSIKWDYWQTILSRGDENLTDLLIYVYKNGGKLGAYKSGLKELNISIEKAINGYDFNDNLPWNFITNYVSKERLLSEYNRLSKYLSL